MSVSLSIITPTYNRAYILPELYNSLLKQSCYDFEWIIIDDGSSDDTPQRVSLWMEKKNPFPIMYFKQKNGGKHRAVNRGVSHASGEFTLIVDSDDILTNDAVSAIVGWITSCKSDVHLGAVSGLKGKKSNGELLGQYPSGKKYVEFIDAKNTERRQYHLLGDKAEVYRTDLLRKNPFREFANENFLTEATVWDELAYQGYHVRWFNKIIYLCEYLEDGLTKSGSEKELRNFEGFSYATMQRIKCNGFFDGLIARGRYMNLAEKKGLSSLEAARKINSPYTLLIFGSFLWKAKELIGYKKCKK